MRSRLVFLASTVVALSLPACAQKPAATDDMHHDKPPVPASTSLTVTYAGSPHTFSLDDLRKLPQVTVEVHNAHRNADESYTGPLLSVVLEQSGLTAAKDTEPTILHSSIIASATDHYFVLYSAAEVEPMFSKGKVIVAISKAGAPDSEGGGIQLINTDGARPARWVHGLSAINVMTLPTK